jgi:uncharacterized protein (DUF934 family)
MPRLIRDGAIVEDAWREADEDLRTPGPEQIATLDQWLQLEEKAGSAVQLEPGQAPAPLVEHLDELALVVVNFPLFTDGRGFSYGRELRERGFQGELRANGHFITDQMSYLCRCGFNAFRLADEGQLDSALGSLSDFSEYYQASVDQPLPLFRRRA